MKSKRRREIDPDYVYWIHSWNCCVPGCTTPWPVHAHHVITRARLGSDRDCLPLCMNHHVGVYGIHGIGQKTFQSRYNIDLMDMVTAFNNLYEIGKKGPHFEKLKGQKIRPFNRDEQESDDD